MNIKITYSRFLEEIYSGFFSSKELVNSSSLFSYSDLPRLSEEKILSKRKEFVEEWNLYGNKIFDQVLKITDLSIERNYLDVYITGIPARSYSSPIVIYANKNKEDFLRVVTHELVHIILREGLGKDYVKIEKILEDFYPEETKLTQIHVLVYSIMGSVFEEIFGNKERLSTEKKDADNYRTNEYSKAFEICDASESYLKTLEKIKLEYKNCTL